MTLTQDTLILNKWQEIGRRKDPSFTLTNKLDYLFYHFKEEDREEAWGLIPEHREVRQRLEEFKESCVVELSTESGLAMNVVPDKNKQPSLVEALKFVEDHFASIKKYIPEEELTEEVAVLLDEADFEIYDPELHDLDQCDDDLEFDLIETLSCYIFEIQQENSCYHALYEYVSHISKVEVVSNYIMTPTFKVGSDFNLFDAAFQMYLNNVSFSILDDSKVVVKINC